MTGCFPEICALAVNAPFWPISDRECASRSPTDVTLDLGLLRDLQGVIDVNAEVPDSALQLAVPDQ